MATDTRKKLASKPEKWEGGKEPTTTNKKTASAKVLNRQQSRVFSIISWGWSGAKGSILAHEKSIKKI